MHRLCCCSVMQRLELQANLNKARLCTNFNAHDVPMVPHTSGLIYPLRLVPARTWALPLARVD